MPDLPALHLWSGCFLQNDGGLQAQTATTPAGRPSHQALPALVSDLAGPGWMVPRIRLISSNACQSPGSTFKVQPWRRFSSAAGVGGAMPPRQRLGLSDHLQCFNRKGAERQGESSCRIVAEWHQPFGPPGFGGCGVRNAHQSPTVRPVARSL